MRLLTNVKKNYDKAHLPWALVYIAICLLFSFSYAYRRIYTVDYSPINGDFQSYNVFRRILGGEIPYTDFANYIGMAPIVFNLPFLLFDPRFSGSLFVTNFTCHILFCLSVFLLFWLITENTPLSFFVSLIFSKIVSSGLLRLVLGAELGYYFSNLYTNLFTPSNSMRIARLFWPFLLVLVYLIINRIHLRRHGSHIPLQAATQSAKYTAILGTVMGFGVLWSNDYGIATALAATILLVLLLVRQPLSVKKRLVNFSAFLACLAAGVFVGAFLVTGANPLAFFRFTADVQEYQYFYFNGTGGRPLLLYVLGNTRLLLFTVPAAVFLLFCLVRLVQNKLSDRLLLIGFIVCSIAAATYGYVLSGSGYNFREALEGYTWVALLALLAKGLLFLLRRWKKTVSIVLCVAMLCSGGVAGISARHSVAGRVGMSGYYIEKLGGYSNYPKALFETRKIIGDAPVFSVYATGLEAVHGDFQPTGYDYIIHVLGDSARQEYLQDFTDNQYPYVQTVSLDVEKWLSVANWYFYREVLAGYTEIFQSEYGRLWQRSESREIPLSTAVLVQVTAVDAGWLITVTAPEGGDFTADICLRYNTRFTSAGGAVLSLGRMMASVACQDLYTPGEHTGAGLPANADECYIPIAVRGGTGSALLFTPNAPYAALTLESAAFVRALPLLSL